MSFKLLVSPHAEEDLEGIRNYLFVQEGSLRADQVMEALHKAILSLDQQPRRGHVPPELVGKGAPEVFEIHHKPWRIIYETDAKSVRILVVADGRRDFRSLLTKRLIRPS